MGEASHKIERGRLMQGTKNRTAQTPLTLKEWIYTTDGKHITELVQVSFLEFYFSKKATEIRKVA